MPINENYEERKLLLLLAEGSEYAFQLIFDRHRNRVFKLAILYVKSPAIAEDIVQDVFLKIWYQRNNLPAVLSLDAWIYTITRNLTLNSLKKLSNEWNARGKWGNLQLEPENTTDHKVRSAQYNQLLSQAIGQLTAQQQNVYRLAKEDGLSYDAIAQQLVLSPYTVKTHMANALAAIRRFLKSHDKEFLFILIVGKHLFYFF